MKLLTLQILVLITINIGSTECLNFTERYFLNIDLSNCPGSIGRELKSINKTLCFDSSPLDVNSTVTCFLQFKVVGEPRTFVVVDVQNNAELERRLFQLTTQCVYKFESDRVVDYDQLARFSGVDVSLIKLGKNPFANVTEAVWCQFEINFGDKNATEALAIWKKEAELVFKYKTMGYPVEIFEILGKRKVHVLVAQEMFVLDQFWFSTPFNQNIPNILPTKCKTIIDFKTALSRLD